MKGFSFGLLMPMVCPVVLACSGATQGSSNTGNTEQADTSTQDTNEDGVGPTTGLSTQTLVHDELERGYLQYIPDSYDGSTEVPVMLSFHGWAGTASEQMAMSDMRALAESEKFILIYPQGSLDDGYSHWNTYLPGEDNKSDADDFGFVEAILEALAADYVIDASRVYATGYSNGGDFSYTLACFLSDKVTAIASVSGLMWEQTERDCGPTHPTAVMSMHGTQDSDRPYEGYGGYLMSIDDSTTYWNDHNGITGSATMTTFEDSGLDIERYEYTDGEGGVAQTHYKIIGGQHVWFDIGDEGVETDRLIWNFVSRFDQNGAL